MSLLAGTRERAQQLLTRFGMQKQSGEFAHRLSGGQRQRVAIAQQFMCSEHFLLMDEPFSGLDPLAIDEVCALIKEVVSLDTLNTVVLVTHDIGTALSVADQVLLLGRERDASGLPIDGAQVIAEYNLAERGFARAPDIRARPELHALEREVREWFPRL